MNINDFLAKEKEKPLDNYVSDGGFCRVFRTIGCIGDSLSSGEFECQNSDGTKIYPDFYEYSWGQFIARNTGCKVFNFSKGGMTAKAFMEGFGENVGCFKEENRCQAYIIALGFNELLVQHMELGSVLDIDINNPDNNKTTFAGYYGRVIQKIKEIQPDAKIFLTTLARYKPDAPCHPMTSLLYDIQKMFSNIYILDLEEYGPIHDKEFYENFYLNGHLNAAGYILTSKLIISYIDYIVRHNFSNFSDVGLIGTPYRK